MNKEQSYPIDFEAYDTDELVDLVEFLSLIEKHHASAESVSKETLRAAHRRFREILNNVSEEKRIDKAFQKQTGISIYKTMKNL